MDINKMIVKLETIKKVESNSKEIYESANDLFKIASRETNHLGMMVSDFYFAYYYFQFVKNYNKALNYINSCLEEEKIVGHDVYQMKSYALKASIEIKLSNHYEAVMSVLVSIKAARALDNKKGIVRAHNILGDIFMQLKDFDYALKYYDEAKNSCELYEIEKDMLYQKCLYDYIFTNVMVGKYDALTRTMNLAFMIFDDELLVPFKSLKEIVNLYKRMSYVETSIVDDIYKILLLIDDVTDEIVKLGQLLLIDKLVEFTNDFNLYSEYVDLLMAYSNDLNTPSIKVKALDIKMKLLGISEDVSEEVFSYFEDFKLKDGYFITSLSKSIKKILNLNQVVVERDTEIEKNKKLMELSSTDDLTKLFNRRYSEDTIGQLLIDPTKASYAFLIIDVDKFKSINDTYGHTSGDIALVFLADSLKKIFDKDALISRLGGDEFTVFLYNLPTQYEIRKSVIEYKLDGLNTYLVENKISELDNQCLSVSIGVTLEGNDFNELYSNADVALYNSKYSGRGIYSIYADKTKINNLE